MLLRVHAEHPYSIQQNLKSCNAEHTLVFFEEALSDRYVAESRLTRSRGLCSQATIASSVDKTRLQTLNQCKERQFESWIGFVPIVRH